MGLVTWLSDHSLAVLLTVSAAFTYWWLWRCRERLRLEHRLAALALAAGHIFIGLFSVKAFAVLEAFDMGAMGNMSLFGAVFFMPLVYWAFAKLSGRSAADVFDVFTVCLVFTLMCARLNCIFSGCCLGAHIPIELRDGDEIKNLWYEKPMALPEVKCFNPSFDVTDHELLTGIVTEKGICYPPFTESLAALFDDKK